MRLNLLFFRAVVVSKAPVVLGLSQFLLGRFHLVKHLAQLMRVLPDQRENFCFLPDVVASVRTKEGAMSAYAALATREADQLFRVSMLCANAERPFLLLLLFHFDLHFGLRESVLKVH